MTCLLAPYPPVVVTTWPTLLGSPSVTRPSKTCGAGRRSGCAGPCCACSRPPTVCTRKGEPSPPWHPQRAPGTAAGPARCSAAAPFPPAAQCCRSPGPHRLLPLPLLRAEPQLLQRLRQRIQGARPNANVLASAQSLRREGQVSVRLPRRRRGLRPPAVPAAAPRRRQVGAPQARPTPPYSPSRLTCPHTSPGRPASAPGGLGEGQIKWERSCRAPAQLRCSPVALSPGCCLCRLPWLLPCAGGPGVSQAPGVGRS